MTTIETAEKLVAMGFEVAVLPSLQQPGPKTSTYVKEFSWLRGDESLAVRAIRVAKPIVALRVDRMVYPDVYELLASFGPTFQVESAQYDFVTFKYTDATIREGRIGGGPLTGTEVIDRSGFVAAGLAWSRRGDSIVPITTTGDEVAEMPAELRSLLKEVNVLDDSWGWR